ncbi:MAG: helix-turn-helix domain-containing protein [Calditrichaeota bacterium]|nr:MAG: helix-turn-helix domain-containing protein [Calditrichota bacterium]
MSPSASVSTSASGSTGQCRRRGISRTQFYEHKRRFQTHGIEGLRDQDASDSERP